MSKSTTVLLDLLPPPSLLSMDASSTTLPPLVVYGKGGSRPKVPTESIPSPRDATMADIPTQKPKGRVKPSPASPGGVELSVFDILNTFRRRWFLSRSHLLTNVISAQKAEDGNIFWVEFLPPFHAHLVKCAIALVPHPVPVAKVKKVMFVFVLELLNREGHMAFFELQKGGRKANNAQKEKRRLARKRSCAAKRERDREAAKAAKLPPRERECLTCGRKFQSRKTAKRHKCTRHSKVVRDKGKAIAESGSHPPPPIPLNKPAAHPAPVAPTAPSHSNAVPPVTGDLGVPPNFLPLIQLLPTIRHISNLSSEECQTMKEQFTGNFWSYPALQARYRQLEIRLADAEADEDLEGTRKRRRQ